MGPPQIFNLWSKDLARLPEVPEKFIFLGLGFPPFALICCGIVLETEAELQG